VITEVVADAAAVGSRAAGVIVEALATSRSRDCFLLGCPGGRSPRTTYQALAAQAAASELDLSRVVIVMMDDYVARVDGRPRRVSPSLPHSCEGFGRREIIDVLNAGLPSHHQVRPENLWLPDPSRPDAYDDRIADAGGVDLFLLASGASDGHVAFNAPGAAPDSRTRLVTLPDSTRRDNLATFPSFGRVLDKVPTEGVTVGLGTIRDLSRRVLLIMHGPDKQLTTQRVLSATRHAVDWPATIVAECPDAHVIVDESAAARGSDPHPPCGREDD
jgi:glucosamine-6-phosphate deaminase